ncbi:unnamed protein product, partial [Prorocentrum cordatum]
VSFCAEEADRRTIMRHVHACLAAPQSSEWRQVYLGLQVLEQLFSKGPPELVTEAATGGHFDVVQRLSFLEKYEMGIDVRVQNLIRRRATAMKADWLERQAGAELGDNGDGAMKAAGSQEAKTPAARSSKSFHTAFSGASDDAGGSGDEGPRARAGGAYSSDPRVRTTGRRPMDDSTDDEDGGAHSRRAEPSRAVVAKKPSPPAQEVDLMGLLDDPVAPAGSRERALPPPCSEGGRAGKRGGMRQGLPRGREVIRASRFAVLVPSPPPPRPPLLPLGGRRESAKLFALRASRSAKRELRSP